MYTTLLMATSYWGEELNEWMMVKKKWLISLCDLCDTQISELAQLYSVPNPSVWLTFCMWCFSGCACSMVLAAERLSLVASVGSNTPARRRRRRRAWVTGRAFISEFQSERVLICCTSVISWTSPWHRPVYCLLKTANSVVQRTVNWAEAILTGSHSYKTTVALATWPCVLQI